MFTFHAPNTDATDHLGRVLAQNLPSPCAVALIGTLGAGKTRLVQSVAQACGIDARGVISPTFVLIREYVGRRTIFHLDAYRLDDDEFLALGPDEAFESDAITFIEWADRVEACMPTEYVRVEIDIAGAQERDFSISAAGGRSDDLIERLRKELGV